MLKRTYARLKAFGLLAFVGNVYRAVVPYHLRYFSHCKSVFERGIGLEIGGPSSIFDSRGSIPVYPVAAHIDNCNFGGSTVWEGSIREGNTFVFDQQKSPGRQYVIEASHLYGINDASYDYVLSSHCIEHLANPLLGLSEWIRVLKEGGLLVLVVPHKDGSFDHRRPVTSMNHLVQDLLDHTDETDQTHLDEILRLHDLSMDSGSKDFKTFESRSNRNTENRCLHHHVFDARLAIDMLDYMRLQLLAVEIFRPFHIVLVAKKLPLDQVADNSEFKGNGQSPRWNSPFPSDQSLH